MDGGFDDSTAHYRGRRLLFPRLDVRLCRLRQDRFDDFRRLNSGQAEVEPLELVREPHVIDAQQMQHGGMKISHMHFVFDGVVAEFIGLAIVHATLDSTASHPH